MIRFGDCRLDLDAHRVFRGNREVHLPPKAFELLKLLVENRPRALSKTELLERVWQGVFVSDGSLAKVVNQIREGIGDNARRPRIVRTVHGYGYAFDATVVADATPGQTASDRSACWLSCQNRRFALPDGEHIAGRDSDVSIWLDSPKVSRRHARIAVDGLRVTIEDLTSKNGTFVRGVRVAAPTPLEPGDRIRIGEFTLVFHAARPAATTETESITRRTARRPT
jgi:DNA-binding winged helix-turn-helix (wHTH) protein